MPNRKLFLRYPPHWENHPDVLNKRVTAIEDHLETKSSVTSLTSYLPTAILFLLYILGGLGLVSPEKVEGLSKLLGH